MSFCAFMGTDKHGQARAKCLSLPFWALLSFIHWIRMLGQLCELKTSVRTPNGRNIFFSFSGRKITRSKWVILGRGEEEDDQKEIFAQITQSWRREWWKMLTTTSLRSMQSMARRRPLKIHVHCHKTHTHWLNSQQDEATVVSRQKHKWDVTVSQYLRKDSWFKASFVQSKRARRKGRRSKLFN